MSTTVVALVGVVFVVALVLPIVRPRGIDGLLRQVRKTGDLRPLAVALTTAPEAKRADTIDQTFTRLWNGYERDTAAKLLVEIAPQSDAMIVQYWMRQVLEIEPEIAAEVFSMEFVEEHFNPEVASKCGRCGCKG